MAYMKSKGIPAEKVQIVVLIHPESYDSLRDKCRAEGTQMNLILECFMRQYASGMRIQMTKKRTGAGIQMGTTIHKNVADAFKQECRNEGNSVRHVLESFIALYNEGKYELALRKKE